MKEEEYQIAVPWSLSHYIPLNGFHPLYQALFDHAPDSLKFSAWDNVKLDQLFKSDEHVRADVIQQIKRHQSSRQSKEEGAIASAYSDHYWSPNKFLTTGLPGQLEFHHTAPYPSMNRPFILHLESFSPMFFPFGQQGSGRFDRHHEVKEHYRTLLASPLCLGIFSHIPETLESIRLFFEDVAINNKLFASRIGISIPDVQPDIKYRNSRLSVPRFLFINSAHQGLNFFKRGGHLVLRFWKEFLASGRAGKLILRCAKPPTVDLEAHGVDMGFLEAESTRSILWAQDYLTAYELNQLMASTDFFLLPSLSLHSVSIMHALAMGAIPVLSDTVGVDTYVEDGKTGIILHGLREQVWARDSETGILFDRYTRSATLEESLVSQMVTRVNAILSDTTECNALRSRSIEISRTRFSGERFASDFWAMVMRLYRESHPVFATSKSTNAIPELRTCLLEGTRWNQVWESTTQPMQRIHLGDMTICELGGAYVKIRSSTPNVHAWSIMAPYLLSESVDATFAISIADLQNAIFARPGDDLNARSKLPRIVMRLKHYPRIFRLLQQAFNKYLSTRLFFFRWRAFLRYNQLVHIDDAPDVELVMQDFSGFNVLRFFHTYHAIPMAEGAFSYDKVKAGQYSLSFSGFSLKSVQTKVASSARPSLPQQTEHPPELVEEGISGYNIIRCQNEFFAVHQIDGAFDYDKIKSNKYKYPTYSAKTISELKSIL